MSLMTPTKFLKEILSLSHYQSNQQNKQGNDVGTQYRAGVDTRYAILEVINQVFADSC